MYWVASQYSKFEKERNRPIVDLLAHVPVSGIQKIADIGCGPGNSTEILQNWFPKASVIGMDSSPDMIAAAQERLPDIRFELADIDGWKDDGPYDLIFANAVLQWVPDHGRVFPELLRRVAPYGALAVQMPDNYDEPSHRLMREIALSGSWAKRLEPATKRVARETVDWYYRTLKPLVRDLDIWRTIYYHPLAGGAAAIVEWVKGTGLRPYLEALDESEKGEFIARYQEEIARAYPTYPDGSVVIAFPRIFIVATR